MFCCIAQRGLPDSRPERTNRGATFAKIGPTIVCVTRQNGGSRANEKPSRPIREMKESEGFRGKPKVPAVRAPETGGLCAKAAELTNHLATRGVATLRTLA